MLEQLGDIIRSIKEWIVHLFDPHCVVCAHKNDCKNCELLKEMLEAERWEKRKILDSMLYKPEQNTQVPQPDHMSFGRKFIPWNIRAEMLQAQDRKKAQVLHDLAEEKKAADLLEKVHVEQLERELGIESEMSEENAS